MSLKGLKVPSTSSVEVCRREDRDLLASAKRVASALARVAEPILRANSGSDRRIVDRRVPRYSSAFPAGRARVAWVLCAHLFVMVLSSYGV